MESNYSTEYIQLMNQLEKQKRDFETLCDREICPLCRQKLLINPQHEINAIDQQIKEIKEKYEEEVTQKRKIEEKIIEVNNKIYHQKEEYYRQNKSRIAKIVKKRLSLYDISSFTIPTLPITEYHLWDYAMERYLDEMDYDRDEYPELFC